MEMPEALKKKRDELYPVRPESKCYGPIDLWDNERNRRRVEGFNSCWEELAPVVDALETNMAAVAALTTLIHGKYDHSHFALKQARQALDKLKGADDEQ